MVLSHLRRVMGAWFLFCRGFDSSDSSLVEFLRLPDRVSFVYAIESTVERCLTDDGLAAEWIVNGILFISCLLYAHLLELTVLNIILIGSLLDILVTSNNLHRLISNIAQTSNYPWYILKAIDPIIQMVIPQGLATLMMLLIVIIWFFLAIIVFDRFSADLWCAILWENVGFFYGILNFIIQYIEWGMGRRWLCGAFDNFIFVEVFLFNLFLVMVHEIFFAVVLAFVLTCTVILYGKLFAWTQLLLVQQGIGRTRRGLSLVLIIIDNLNWLHSIIKTDLGTWLLLTLFAWALLKELQIINFTMISLLFHILAISTQFLGQLFAIITTSSAFWCTNLLTLLLLPLFDWYLKVVLLIRHNVWILPVFLPLEALPLEIVNECLRVTFWTQGSVIVYAVDPLILIEKSLGVVFLLIIHIQSII